MILLDQIKNALFVFILQMGKHIRMLTLEWNIGESFYMNLVA